MTEAFHKNSRLARAALVLGFAGVLVFDAQAQVPKAEDSLARRQVLVAADREDLGLTRISWIVPGPGRGMFVLDAATTTIFQFSSTGQLVRRIGRGGGGPGEFTAPTTLGTFGDTLWVFDNALTRISVFDTAGRFLNSFPMRVGGDGALLRDRTIAVLPFRTRRGQGETVQEFRVRRFTLGGDSLPDAFRTRLTYRSLRYNTPAGVVVGRQPFDFAPYFQAASDGLGFLYVQRELPTRREGSIVVERLMSTGARRWKVAVPYVARPLTSRVADSVARFLASPSGAPPLPGVEDAIREALFVPRYLPSVTAVVDGPDGTVWLRREDEGGLAISWLVLSGRGRVLGTIELPREFFPQIVTPEWAIGVEKNPDGVPAIVRYDIHLRQ